MSKLRVLVVDDEAALRESLGFAFSREGFDVVTAADGPSALAIAEGSPPDAVVLDVMLPNVDGLEVCRRLRARSDVPIVMLTARDQANDKLHGFELGADDYVTKPFATRELIARTRAVVRRRNAARELLAEDRALVSRLEELASLLPPKPDPAADARNADAPPVRVGALTIDSARGEITLDGRVVAVTTPEFRVLALLARSAGRVVTRTELIASVWGDDGSAERRAMLDACIRVLREKFETDPARPTRIVAVPGIGYRFA